MGGVGQGAKCFICSIKVGDVEIWKLKRSKNPRVHPDSAIDKFGGSGSTLIACEQLNRICYMMEIDPVYCDVIVKRWENLTRQKAVLAE